MKITHAIPVVTLCEGDFVAIVQLDHQKVEIRHTTVKVSAIGQYCMEKVLSAFITQKSNDVASALLSAALQWRRIQEAAEAVQDYRTRPTAYNLTGSNDEMQKCRPVSPW